MRLTYVPVMVKVGQYASNLCTSSALKVEHYPVSCEPELCICDSML